MNDLLEAIRAGVPGAGVDVVENPGPSGQHALLLAGSTAVAVAEFLRDSRGWDFCSNVTGVDWPARKVKEVRKTIQDGKEISESTEVDVPGYLEVVYHLYSLARKAGPLVLRMRTGSRGDDVSVPSLTPVWKSAEFQEREAFDLFGIQFSGHPDLRRILMWDEFEDFPMRKDYVAPDDCEYEPTPHDEILERVNARRGDA